MFKKLEINIPFVEALTQMPHYEKFIKDIISKKRKLDEDGVENLSVTYSVIIQKKHTIEDARSRKFHDSCHGRVSGINKICFLCSSYCRSQATAA